MPPLPCGCNLGKGSFVLEETKGYRQVGGVFVRRPNLSLKRYFHIPWCEGEKHVFTITDKWNGRVYTFLKNRNNEAHFRQNSKNIAAWNTNQFHTIKYCYANRNYHPMNCFTNQKTGLLLI